ncbi:type II toxin-antitoxin system YoeB family toxin [Fusobacterium polymorphum]|uniref:type II toxin-antitoxin system YoeB family toxin n=1 Tax=Fusobacterium nucleatum subsp. polymorphum TaxID=76857 RepID=UPI003CC63052
MERYGVLEGRGKPKKLKYREEYSRRIDEEHRLIYKVQNNIIIIVSCKGHYVKERK